MSDLADAFAWAIAHRKPFGASEESEPPLSLTRAQIAALEAEARRVLAEVEPVHAREERAHYECDRLCAKVDPFPHRIGVERPTMDKRNWRPRATRTRSGWAIAGGWLDAAVPELPTLPERGVRVRLLADRVERARREEIGGVIGELLGPFAPCWPEHIDGSNPHPTAEAWQSTRRGARKSPRSTLIGRGWCAGLGANADFMARGVAAGWRSMQRACAAVMATTDAQWRTERAAIVAAQSREAT